MSTWVQKLINYCLCKQGYAWNPSICTCECARGWWMFRKLLKKGTGSLSAVIENQAF